MPILRVKVVVEEGFRRRVGFQDQPKVINRDGRLLNCAQSTDAAGEGTLSPMFSSRHFFLIFVTTASSLKNDRLCAIVLVCDSMILLTLIGGFLGAFGVGT